MEEIREFEVHMPQGFTAPHNIRWLQAGQKFVV